MITHAPSSAYIKQATCALCVTKRHAMIQLSLLALPWHCEVLLLWCLQYKCLRPKRPSRCIAIYRDMRYRPQHTRRSIFRYISLYIAMVVCILLRGNKSKHTHKDFVGRLARRSNSMCNVYINGALQGARHLCVPNLCVCSHLTGRTIVVRTCTVEGHIQATLLLWRLARRPYKNIMI